METTLNQTISAQYVEQKSGSSVLTRFMNYCKRQEENRLLWVGVALAAHGCVITPLTIMVVLLAGTNLTLFILALASMGLALVTNLAAMPTRITIPAFVLSIIIDVAIIISCFFIGFDITKTYI